MLTERQRMLPEKCQDTMLVFQPGLPGLEGYTSFRIPSIVFHKDELLAFCEGRKKSTKDSGPIDIVMRRGRVEVGGEVVSVNWEVGLKVVIPADRDYRAMNTCPIVDVKTGHTVLVYTRFPVNKTEREQIRCEKYDQQVCCVISQDNGNQWSSPIYLTNVLDELKPKPILYAPGPGHGIQMTKTGRLIVSGNIQYKTKTRFPRVRSLLSRVVPFIGADGRACLIYSDDHGKSWHALSTIPSTRYGRGRVHYANESQAAEMSDGCLYVTSRTRQPTCDRQNVCCSAKGEVIAEPETTALYEPSGVSRALSCLIPNCFVVGGCQGSILSVAHPKYKESKVLVFSNPASRWKRKNISLRVSKDSGRTWTDPLPLHPGPSAYSDLVAFRTAGGSDEQGPDYLGCLYECGDEGQYVASKIVLDVVQVEQLLSKTLDDWTD